MSQSNVCLKVNCVSCGNEQEVSVDNRGYQQWLSGLAIQRALPKSHSFDRDVLITHMCYACLSKTYNQPVPGNDWGAVAQECYCCGANLYERNRNESGDLICPCCCMNQSEGDKD